MMFLLLLPIALITVIFAAAFVIVRHGTTPRAHK
jgi:uncharacterized protein (UPF0333 family)